MKQPAFRSQICSEGPIVRMQVTPEDTHMAFVTANQLTPYDNANHLEMYSYNPSNGSIVCDSCNPNGQPPTADVYASQDGLFLTNDGRTFFSTTEALTSQDTDEGEDVYEYVDGRPHLITPGTGTATAPAGESGSNGEGVNLVSISETAGLVGVSADGTDVYFSTYDSLIPTDHNGSFLKFYDARSNGGFPRATPVPPCAAAEECHGAGSEPPNLPTQGTLAGLSDGNVTTSWTGTARRSNTSASLQTGIIGPGVTPSEAPKVTWPARLVVTSDSDGANARHRCGKEDLPGARPTRLAEMRMVGIRRIVMRRFCVAVATTAAFLLLVVPAAASVPIFSYNALPSTTEAGAHPDVEFSFGLGNHQGAPTPCSCDDARNVTVHLPTGLVVNPHAAPECTLALFATEQCPVDSQIGVTEIGVTVLPKGIGFSNGEDIEHFLSPLFNLVPPPEETGLLGFKTSFSTPVFVTATARTNSDYGLNAAVLNTEHFAPLRYVKQVLWGIPASPIHNSMRFARSQTPLPSIFGLGLELCDQNGKPSNENPGSLYQICGNAFHPEPFAVGESSEGGGVGHPVLSNSPETPFTQNPTTCGVSSLESSLNILAYDEGETNANAPYPATTDCLALAFNPSLFAQPTTESTDTPSGINLDLKAPEFESPSAPSPSEIRGATITFPPGFTINPNAADGKSSCTEAEARFHTTEEAHCPEFAKVGSVEVHSPVLPGTLPGAVYIGQPEPGDRYRLFVTFDGFGIHVKLPGSVRPDLKTGQFVTEFKELPSSPSKTSICISSVLNGGSLPPLLSVVNTR